MDDLTNISDMQVFKSGEHYVVEYLLVNKEFTRSKHQVYKAKRYQVFKDKIQELLTTMELV